MDCFFLLGELQFWYCHSALFVASKMKHLSRCLMWFYRCFFSQVPDQYGTIRAVAEGKADQFLVGTSRNFVLRGTFNDGFVVEVQVSITCFFKLWPKNVKVFSAGVLFWDSSFSSLLSHMWFLSRDIQMSSGDWHLILSKTYF